MKTSCKKVIYFFLFTPLFMQAAEYFPHEKNAQGNTLLHIAAYNFSPESANSALHHAIINGKNIDTENNNRETAVVIAARYGNIYCLEGLLRTGANPFVRDRDGNLASDTAIKNDQFIAAAILLAAQINKRKK